MIASDVRLNRKNCLPDTPLGYAPTALHRFAPADTLCSILPVFAAPSTPIEARKQAIWQ